MAATYIARSARANLTLAWGTDPDTGKATTKNVTLNALATNADATALMNVVDLAAPCLEKPVAKVTYTVTRDVEKE